MHSESKFTLQQRSIIFKHVALFALGLLIKESLNKLIQHLNTSNFYLPEQRAHYKPVECNTGVVPSHGWCLSNHVRHPGGSLSAPGLDPIAGS